MHFHLAEGFQSSLEKFNIRETVREKRILLHVTAVVAKAPVPRWSFSNLFESNLWPVERDHTDLDTLCVAPWMPSLTGCS